MSDPTNHRYACVKCGESLRENEMPTVCVETTAPTMNEQESITSSGDYLAILRELRDYNRGIAEYIKGPSFEADRADALDTAIQVLTARQEDEDEPNLAGESVPGCLPCPYCGSSIVAIGYNRFGHRVDCLSCDPHDRHETKREAVEAWNTRSKS